MHRSKKHIVIIGGGFAGISAALKLWKKKRDDIVITLISKDADFSYHAALYRVVVSNSIDEVAIPLKRIFKNKPINVVTDELIGIESKKKKAICKNDTFDYDYLVVAIGSEPAYYQIPGLKTHAYTLYNTEDAQRLHSHIHDMACSAVKTPHDAVEDVHFVIVGGGATGVELAGELAAHAQSISSQYNLDPSFVTVDLIEAKNRVLSHFPEKVSKKIELRLRSLGVNLFLNRTVVKNDKGELHLADMDIKAKTIIWAAGVKAHSLYQKLDCFECDKRGKVCVDESLRVKGCKDIYIAGDAASTLYSGLAPVALEHGSFVAEHIHASLNEQQPPKLTESRPLSAIPVGPRWAFFTRGNTFIYGYLGWILRRFVDFRFFNTILPFRTALSLFKKARF